MERQVTVLSVAQIQSMALKTLGFRGDTEVRIKHPYQDSMEVEFDIYHVRIGVDYDGSWQAWGINKETGDAERILDHGKVPDLGIRPEGQVRPV